MLELDGQSTPDVLCHVQIPTQNFAAGLFMFYTFLPPSSIRFCLSIDKVKREAETRRKKFAASQLLFPKSFKVKEGSDATKKTRKNASGINGGVSLCQTNGGIMHASVTDVCRSTH